MRILVVFDIPVGRECKVDGTRPSLRYLPPKSMNGMETMLMRDMAEDQTLSSAEGTAEAFSTGTLNTAREKREPSRKSRQVANASWVHLVSTEDDIVGVARVMMSLVS